MGRIIHVSGRPTAKAGLLFFNAGRNNTTHEEELWRYDGPGVATKVWQTTNAGGDSWPRISHLAYCQAIDRLLIFVFGEELDGNGLEQVSIYEFNIDTLAAVRRGVYNTVAPNAYQGSPITGAAEFGGLMYLDGMDIDYGQADGIWTYNPTTYEMTLLVQPYDGDTYYDEHGYYSMYQNNAPKNIGGIAVLNNASVIGLNGIRLYQFGGGSILLKLSDADDSGGKTFTVNTTTEYIWNGVGDFQTGPDGRVYMASQINWASPHTLLRINPDGSLENLYTNANPYDQYYQYSDSGVFARALPDGTICLMSSSMLGGIQVAYLEVYQSGAWSTIALGAHSFPETGRIATVCQGALHWLSTTATGLRLNALLAGTPTALYDFNLTGYQGAEWNPLAVARGGLCHTV